MTYARSRSRIGARPRITRYARNNADTKALSNPLLQLPLYAGFWGDDPAWTDNPGVGQAVSSWRNGGTLAASGAYLDPTLGLVLPGVAGNYASVPDEAALDITGDITLVARVAMADWTPGSTSCLFGKYRTTGNQRSYRVDVNVTGSVSLTWSVDGINPVSITSNANLSATAPGETLWIAATLDVDAGGGNRSGTFWTSTDGVTWTQLGTTVTAAGTTSIFSGSGVVEFGSTADGTTFNLNGNLSVARVYSGSGFTTGGPSGTLVLDVDFRRTAVGAFTASTGQTVTVASTFNALQATAGSRPTLTTSATLGGRRVVDFDGTDDRLEITTGVSLAQPYEVWAIVTLDAVAALQHSILGLQSGETTRRAGTTNTGPSWALRTGSTTLGAGTPVVNAGYALRFVANGASSSIVVNGSSVAAGDASSGALNQIVLGAGRQAPSTYGTHLNGQIAFLGILPAASITAAHRRQYALWAAQFYSVPGFAAAA